MGVYRIAKALLIPIILFSSFKAVGQDCSIDSRANDLIQSRTCAPVDVSWDITYRGVTGTTIEFFVDWDDGTVEIIPTILTNPATEEYKPAIPVTHQYPKGLDQCNYNPTVTLMVDGVECTSSLQTQNVTVWDTDEDNGGELRVNPQLYRVCWGSDASVTFEDNSLWNCVPPDENDVINNSGRWLQWQYGTGNAANRILNVTIGGTAQTYQYDGPIDFLPGPVTGSNAVSDVVYVPPTVQADVGKEFVVTLRNWNICNPYDTDITDGDPFNPTTGDLADGDSTPVITNAIIRIVDKANPNYQTKLNDALGSVQTVFCIGDQIYFEDLTPGITGADFQYTWELYDNDTGTGTPIATSNSQNTTFSYSTSGEKFIRLTVTDGESVGNCGGYVEKTVTIFPSAEATLATTDLSDNPIVPEFCQDIALTNTFQIKINDVTTGYNATSTWEWNFFAKNNNSIIESTHTGTGTTGTSFIRTYTEPGTYMIELISSNSGINCNTRDTLYIKVFSNPVADFTANEVCEDESTTFSSTATIPTIVDGDSISTYAWDFDYDGITFNPDVINNSADPFTYRLGPAGTYQVALQVTTAKGGCSDLIVKNVEVKPIPFTSFIADPTEGCPDLEVNFSLDTLLTNQPVGITKYIWHISDHYTGTVTTYEVDPPQDSFTAPPFTYDRSDNQLHTYGVQLEAITTNGCNRISEPDTIRVYPNPGSGFVITNLSSADKNCSPRNYAFRANKATRDLYPDSYHWMIEDEDSNIVVDTTIVSSDPDFSQVLTNDNILVKSFTVTMQPEKSGMCIQPSFHTVNVNPIPSAEFTITEIYSDCSIVTYFVEAEQKSIVYDWDVSTPPVNSPDLTNDRMELTFDRMVGSSQDIDIQLITTNVAGCKSIPSVESISISEKENINASFTIDPIKQKIPNSTVTITNNTTPGSWAYLWEFGDGATSTAVNPVSYTYDSYGNYQIKLSVTGKNCSESDSIVAVIEPTLPVVDFTYSQVDGCLPVIVSFTNLSEYSNPDTYLWDFGDGNISTEENPTHTYRENGVYTVTLQASNILGVLIKAEKQIVVELENGPEADFNIQKATKYLPDEPVYISNYSQNANNYLWDFGDGATSTQVEPQHLYRNSGDYEITLIAYNSNGCTDTITSLITILPIEPVVDFEFTPTSGCRPLTVQFTNLTRYAEPDSYYWTFGQGQGISTEENPSYTYYEPGVYTVTLRASNSAGVTVEERKEFSIEVYDNPIAGFSIRPEEVFLPQPIFLANLSRGATSYYWNFGDGTTSTEFEPQHVYVNAGSYDITLIAENEHGCKDTLRQENAVFVEKGGNINIPNAFTPSLDGPGAGDIINGNNYNDVFLPVFEGVTDFHMLIYNRWGELLFESYDKSMGWDGYFKGKLSAKDVYVYKLHLKFSDGRRETIAGDVTLLR